MEETAPVTVDEKVSSSSSVAVEAAVKGRKKRPPSTESSTTAETSDVIDLLQAVETVVPPPVRSTRLRSAAAPSPKAPLPQKETEEEVQTKRSKLRKKAAPFSIDEEEMEAQKPQATPILQSEEPFSSSSTSVPVVADGEVKVVRGVKSRKLASSSHTALTTFIDGIPSKNPVVKALSTNAKPVKLISSSFSSSAAAIPTVEVAGTPLFRLHRLGDTKSIFPLSEVPGSRWTVGRNPACHIHLANPYISEWYFSLLHLNILCLKVVGFIVMPIFVLLIISYLYTTMDHQMEVS